MRDRILGVHAILAPQREDAPLPSPTLKTTCDKLNQRHFTRFTRVADRAKSTDMTQITDTPKIEDHTKSFPFDRVGVLALIWAAIFVLAAAGLTLAIG